MTAQTAATAFTLRYVKTVGMYEVKVGRSFYHPYDLAVGRDGRIFVLNRCETTRGEPLRVSICNLAEDYLGDVGDGYGDGDGQFILPTCMALDSRNELYVTDEYLHRISVFDSSGIFLRKWGVFGDAEGQLNGPAGIVFDSNDNAYVVDQHNNRVQKFTREGEYVLQWGGKGSGDGQFNLPWGVTVDSHDNVYVADWRNDRIQKFTQDGKLEARFGESGEGDGQFHRPSNMAVDQDGYIYVADWGNERVQVLGPDGSFKLKLRGEATLSKWATEWLAANPDEKEWREKSNLIPTVPSHLSTPHHVSSQTEPYFGGPVGVALDGEGRLYVAESMRHRFQVYERG